MEAYRAKILVVDDEESNLLAMKKILEKEAYQVATAKQAAMALSLLKRQPFDLILSDLRMPGVSGLELLRAIRKENASLPVLMLTAYGTVNDAVEAMKLGAIDFLSKPLRRETILKSVQDALARVASPQESRGKAQLLGNSQGIAQVRKTIRMLARTNASVLIEGESGTGKEIVAKTIHSESGREGRLIIVNCGAIPESLLESELFGYERGAFTGAVSAKQGLFEVADRGTLFLDEVGDMPLSLQVKLLRAIQDGSFFRLGGTETKRVDVRIVAATNSDLKRKIQEGKFREDLYYRLNVVSIALPALRDRGDDILLLADYFFETAKEVYSRKEVALSAEARMAMEQYPWPGNVRELKNIVERTLVMLDGNVVFPADLGMKEVVATPERLRAMEESQPLVGVGDLRFPFGTTLHDMELEAIRRTLEYTGGDKAKTAEILGINQRTIYRKLPEL